MASSTLPPVFFVYGAFGAGKSTLAPLVAAELTECLVLDVDWLLAPLSRLARRELTDDPESWPALRDFWWVLAGIAGRSGRSTVFFGPEEPANVEALPSASRSPAHRAGCSWTVPTTCSASGWGVATAGSRSGLSIL